MGEFRGRGFCVTIFLFYIYRCNILLESFAKSSQLVLSETDKLNMCTDRSMPEFCSAIPLSYSTSVTYHQFRESDMRLLISEIHFLYLDTFAI